MASYYFPALFLKPAFPEEAMDLGTFAVHRRRWQTSIFDLATLATKHGLAMHYGLLDWLLGYANLEFEVRDADSPEDAHRSLRLLQAVLYSAGCSPFVVPCVTTHSINDYSGINSRDSPTLLAKLPDAMRVGLTTATGRLEGFPTDHSTACIQIAARLDLTPAMLHEAAARLPVWRTLLTANRPLTVVQFAAIAAPQILTVDQSLLHIWTALEALFPSVQSEVTFRLALYYAQLCGGPDRRDTFRQIKDAYRKRSLVAHGTTSGLTVTDWLEAWDLLMGALRAVIARAALPTEADLLAELLGAVPSGA